MMEAPGCRVDDPAWTGTEIGAAEAVPEPIPGVRMTPLYFGGCFGWVHAPTGATHVQGLAAVLCPPLEADARWAHRTLRKLCNRIAGLGIPALRFDLAGTGDSRDLAPGEEALKAWKDSFDDAIDFIKARTGAGRVMLIGLRFGALLAADALARRADVSALALLAPVESGEAYALELSKRGRLPRSFSPADDGIVVGGMEFSGATLQELRGFPCFAPARGAVEGIPALLLTPVRKHTPWAGMLHQAGMDLSHADFAGYAELMASAINNRVPYDALDAVAGWAAGSVMPRIEASARSAHPVALLDTVGRFGRCREEPLRFGHEGNLFGVLCRPALGPMPALTVLILNTGGDPRCGIGRLGIHLARRLAEEGVASLRMDLAGLGDSIFGVDEDTVHIFETDRDDDIDAALAALQRLGARSFGATGICAGAYHAFHAAVRDRRFTSIAPINLPVFRWQEGASVTDLVRRAHRSTEFYRRGLVGAHNWVRLVRGEIDVRGILLALSGRFARRLASIKRTTLDRMIPDRGRPTARRMLRTLSSRGVDVLLLNSFEDPAMDALAEDFGRCGRGLAGFAGVSVRILHDADHNLSMPDVRRFAIDALAGHFARSSEARGRPASKEAERPVTAPRGMGAPRP